MQQSSTSTIWKHRGGFGLFWVLFKPGKMCRFFNFADNECNSLLLPLKNSSEKELHQLAEEIQRSSSTAQRLQLAELYFRGKFCRMKAGNDPMQDTIDYIHLDPSLQVQQLADQLHITARHLRRKFKKYIGLPLKCYLQILRICRGMDQLCHHEFNKISDIAYNCGFYDHTHFTSSFKTYTGMTPRDFLKQKPILNSSMYWREQVEHKSIFTI